MIHTEKAFEATIESDLLTIGGYLRGEASAFDPKTALIPEDFRFFLQETQPTTWEKLHKQHGDALAQALLDTLAKEIDHRGRLDVLRHGFSYYGQKIHTAYFRPAHGLNPDTEALYKRNVVVVRRQVPPYANSHHTVDVLLSVNGIAVATLELKNPITGQNCKHAVAQYQNDRDPKAPLFRFKTGALVHFAVDPFEVAMTTRLAGKATYFLPFNRGNDGGAGNPIPADGSYATAYLWREVLQKDSLLDILARFVHLLVEERTVNGKTEKKESLVFPRYHQLDVVRKLEAAARSEGAGASYLVQHSAGSGKSNSIAWTAHRLATLHDADDHKLFHSVVVITDRRVLDKQLQDTIFQFEHKGGVVARIDKDSGQLADHLIKGTPIIITTLQKFPFVAEKVGQLPDRSYAIIVDEAHSSQTGESAQKLKRVLAQADPEAEEPEDPTWEDEICEVMASRGRQKNLSFFAFTATPKGKTLQMFGRVPPDQEKPEAFHLYTMRQAIEEGFILDVLRNYTTYQTYYKLIQTTAQDPDVKKREAATALARFVSLHPHSIAQKVEVIVEHFRAHVRERIGGRAKAMVVTRSRLHAVRYKQALDKYLKDKGYADVNALVAFSGTVTDPDTRQEFSEVGMNPGQKNEKELPEIFAGPDHQVLIVANKYQTGFDQPLLHTMYVDRKLTGVQAVQTLSRLNRTCTGKSETFVLDFVNTADEIQRAFQPFYEGTTITEPSDPQRLYLLRHDLDVGQVWLDSELASFARVMYRPMEKRTGRENEELYRYLQPARDRFTHWEEVDAREEWRGRLASFVRLYAFMSQVIPFTDVDLEIRYAFGRMLLRLLDGPSREHYDFKGDVAIEYLPPPRKTAELSILLEAGQMGEVKPPTDVGTVKPKEDRATLHEIIEILNERFGTDFKAEDRLFIDHAVESAMADADVVAQARANTYDNFALKAVGKVEDLMIDGLDAHQELVTRYLNDLEFKNYFDTYVSRRTYDEIRKAG